METIRAVSPTVSGNDIKVARTVQPFLLNRKFYEFPIKQKALRSMAPALYRKEVKMNQERLKLYRIDIKYVRNLAKIDDNVLSVSPQKNKSNRPFVGIIVINQKKKYCVPLSSPKVKHQNMKSDTPDIRHYKNMAKKQLAWCQKNQDSIVKKVSWTKN